MITTPRDSQASVLELTDSRWLAFCDGHPRATVFHHPAWASVLQDTYGFEGSVLAAVLPDGRVVGGLPFMTVRSVLTGSRRVALPFTDFLPPLSLAGWDDQVDKMVAAWMSAGSPVEVHSQVTEEAKRLVEQGVRHELALGSLEDMRRAISSTPVGRAIRKAGRTDLTVSNETDLGAIRAYYDLHCLTRRRQGVPVQPWRFFVQLQRHVIGAGLGMVVLARLGGQPVAGAIFLTWNSTVIYKYGASDPRFLELRPNNLVMWRAIEWGCEHGYRTLDFGRTDSDNTGLRRYKSGWGAHEMPLLYTELPIARRRRPSELAKRVATVLIQRSPVFTARAIGGLLYGHYA